MGIAFLMTLSAECAWGLATYQGSQCDWSGVNQQKEGGAEVLEVVVMVMCMWVGTGADYIMRGLVNHVERGEDTGNF